jgi:hypothetical protein
LKLYILKLLNYFNYRNELYASAESSWTKDILMLVTYGPLLLLSACSLFLVKRFGFSKFEALFFLIYLSSAFFYAIFVTRIRYRLPFDFLLIMIVALFLHKIYHVWLAKSNPY